MFKISEVISGYTFEKRINRYTGLIKKGNTTEKAFIANTGRLEELLVKGAPVNIKLADNPKRKTKYDLLTIEHKKTIVSIDTRIPNWFFENQLENRKIEELQGYEIKKREFKIGNSRIDYLLQEENIKCLVELKLCTLVQSGEMIFPDAVSERSAKHLYDLISANKQGYRAIVWFIGLRGDPIGFKPNAQLDPKFKEAFDQALEKGVEVLASKTEVSLEKQELIFSDLLKVPIKKGK